jgi:hypothetical protein
MNFRIWLESAAKLDQIGEAIKSAFPQAPFNLETYGPTNVFQVKFPDTGRTLNVVWYEKDHYYAKEHPNGVQIGFFLEDKEKYGAASPKDPASRKELMSGTMEFVHGLKRLIVELKHAGFNPWFNPIDKRRARFFTRLFGVQ